MKVLLQLNEQQNQICFGIPPDNPDPGRCLLLLFNFLYKINYDVMSESLVWDMFFREEKLAEGIPLNRAKEDTVFADWFYSKEDSQQVGFEAESFQNAKSDYYLFLELL